MRILIISNLFPPHVLGGCEILCGQICDALRVRGHEISVLTSDHGASAVELAAAPAKVHRRLRLYKDFDAPGRLHRARRWAVGRESYRIARELIASEQPEVIFIWNLLRLTVGPARAAHDSGVPTAYTFNDENIASYLPVPLSLSPRRIAGWALDHSLLADNTLRGLDFAWSTCISAQLKSKLLAARVPVQAARVIYQGIPVARFPVKEPRPFSCPAKILFAGQLVPSKGIATLIEAAHRLERELPGSAELFIGGGGIPALESALREQAAAGPARVQFLGRIPHEAMPALYRAHDIFVFPSLGPEAFGLTHLESMASGTPVASTATGGQGEFLLDEQNALVFAPGDAVGLAAKLARLIREPALGQRLAGTARSLVEKQFTLERYAAELEELLADASRTVSG